MARSIPMFGSLDGRGCLSTDEVLAHLDQRLNGERLQHVRDHLDECGACRVVMAEAARIATGPTRSHTPRTLTDGETIAGRYQIRRFIARGGMGEVYEASDSALGETIALKTIVVTAVDQSDAVKRLLAEVRIARKVTHPNVCRILEFGTHQRAGSTDEPVPFLTMPLLAGETLARRIERAGRLPPADAVRVLRELALGLAAVHEVGVVHRDFKSDNVFLVRGDDGNERAVVMDFGLARALERQADQYRSTGRILIGTPAYMAPEQVQGTAITKAVDVYAFGVVAFELLTGRLPFIADTAAAVALARLQREVPSPSSMVGGVEKAWDGVIQRCLRRVPEQRYADMNAVVSALDRLRTGTKPRSLRSALALTSVLAALSITWAVISHLHSNMVAPPPAIVEDGARRVVAPVPAPAAARPALGTKAALTLPNSRPLRRKHAPAPLRIAARSVVSSVPPAAPFVPPGQTPKPEATPFDRPVEPRAREADDLVDPF